MQVGEPRYENERKSKNYFNLEKGDNVYRILPPLGNLAQAGHWSKYWSIHWGYKDTKGKNRPFQSPEIKNHNTRMIEVSDAAKVKVDLMSAKRDQLSKELKAAVDSRDVASTKRLSDELNALKEQLKVFRMEKRYFLNAMSLDGKIGLLKIPHKAKVALDEEIKKLRSKGVNPLGVNDGRFFVFSNVGMGTDTSYSVRVYEESIDVAGIGQVKKEMSHSLSNEVLSRLASEAFELDKLYVKPSASQVQAMVDNPSPENVEAIMDTLRVKNSKSENSVEEDLDEEVENDVPELSMATSQPVQTATPQSLGASVNATVVAPTAQTSPQVSQATTTTKTVTSTGQAVAPDYGAMSNEDFLKMING